MKIFRFYITLLLTVLCAIPVCAQRQNGKASYYSRRATGARTASGERLHHDSLTCAHRFYPFGTMLKVTNLANDKSVVVKVTDRGPYGRGRIIDLSWGAAKEIGMLAQGVASVKVEVVDGPVPLRPSDELELPQIDFEVAEAGYSFIDKWKEPEENTEEKEVRHNPHKTKTYTAKSTTKPKAPVNHKSKTKVKAKPMKKEEGNTWSNVFDKIKNWGEDLF